MSTPPKRILVIDDEAVFREAIVHALSPCGYRCVPEENAAEGIMRLKKESFDLILLDIMMEPIDGWDTLAHIRALPGGTNIPVIMSSAKKVNADEIIRYGELVAGFLKKPFVDEEFCEAVTNFFTWNDHLISVALLADAQDVPPEVCDTWIQLSRHIRAINQMKGEISLRCIPDEFSSEEECMERRLNEIEKTLTEKTQKLLELCERYPVFFSAS